MRIVTIAFLLLILLSVRIDNKVVGGNNRIACNALDAKFTAPVKGLLAISILLCHLSGKNVTQVPYVSISVMAPAGVGMFFFFSGYSLIASLKRNPAYFQCFWMKRLVKLGIPYGMLILLYFLIRCVFFEVPITDVIHRIIIGDMPSNTWYIIAVFVFYFLFWLVLRRDGMETRHWILKMFAGTLVYIGICIAIDYPNWWIATCEMFLVGMIFAEKKEQIESFLQKRYRFVFAASALFMAFSYLFPAIYNRLLGVDFLWRHGAFEFDKWLINNILMGSAFPTFFVVAMYKLRVNNKVTDFLGKISLEIYLYHGLIMECLTDLGLEANGELYCIAAVSCTVIIATAMFYGIKVLSMKRRKRE